MDTTTEVQIYLADQRGLAQTASFRSFHTFNFGAYQAEGREPFGSLVLLNDDSLRAGASLRLSVETDMEVWLLPVNGGLEYRVDVRPETPVDGAEPRGFLEPRQAGRFTLPAGTHYTVSNPYEQETIDLLQLWFTRPAPAAGVSLTVLDVDLSRPNVLVPIGETAPRRLLIGQYDGRAEDVLMLNPDEQGVFVFVVQGVFEVANRLLHEKDGLSLRNVQDRRVEFEALSNSAVLLLMTI